MGARGRRADHETPAKAVVSSTAVSPLLASVHPALAYVGYQQEEMDKMRADGGSMKIVLPAVVFGVFTPARQGVIQKRRSNGSSSLQVQEEEAEYCGRTVGRSDDIMAPRK